MFAGLEFEDKICILIFYVYFLCVISAMRWWT